MEDPIVSGSSQEEGAPLPPGSAAAASLRSNVAVPARVGADRHADQVATWLADRHCAVRTNQPAAERDATPAAGDTVHTTDTQAELRRETVSAHVPVSPTCSSSLLHSSAFLSDVDPTDTPE